MPNTPIAEPRLRDLTRSATKAFVDGVTVATDKPRRRLRPPRTIAFWLLTMAGSVTEPRTKPSKIIGLRPIRSETHPLMGFQTKAVTS